MSFLHEVKDIYEQSSYKRPPDSLLEQIKKDAESGKSSCFWYGELNQEQVNWLRNEGLTVVEKVSNRYNDPYFIISGWA